MMDANNPEDMKKVNQWLQTEMNTVFAHFGVPIRIEKTFTGPKQSEYQYNFEDPEALEILDKTVDEVGTRQNNKTLCGFPRTKDDLIDLRFLLMVEMFHWQVIGGGKKEDFDQYWGNIVSIQAKMKEIEQ